MEDKNVNLDICKILQQMAIRSDKVSDFLSSLRRGDEQLLRKTIAK